VDEFSCEFLKKCDFALLAFLSPRHVLGAPAFNQWNQRGSLDYSTNCSATTAFSHQEHRTESQRASERDKREEHYNGLCFDYYVYLSSLLFLVPVNPGCRSDRIRGTIIRGVDWANNEFGARVV
jgi:hypothetical protein